jgi:hypothetical protein
LTDISKEPERVHKMYGTEPGRSSFANNCLLARTLVERGVRFVQLYHRGWDHHGSSGGDDLLNSLPNLCLETDRAAAALIRALRERGLLEATLVIWGGEFGRTPMNESDSVRNTWVAIIIREPSLSGLREAESKWAQASARLTSLATTLLRTPWMFTTFTPQRFTCWDWTTPGWGTGFGAASFD